MTNFIRFILTKVLTLITILFSLIVLVAYKIETHLPTQIFILALMLIFTLDYFEHIGLIK